MTSKKKVYCLYDGRYLTDPDSAIVFEVCRDLGQAKENKDDYGNNTVIVEYDEIDNRLVNPKIIYP